MPGLVLDEIHEDKVIDAMPENGSSLKTKDNLDLSKPPDGMCRQNWFMLALLWLESLELRAPVAGLSIASTTSASLQDSSISRIGVYRFPTCRTLFFGSGGNLPINTHIPI